jgi:hypothetical protein
MVSGVKVSPQNADLVYTGSLDQVSMLQSFCSSSLKGKLKLAGLFSLGMSIISEEGRS